MDSWEVFWLVWILIGATAEGIALWVRRQPGDTLSEKVRHWLAYGPEQMPTPMVWAMRLVLLVGLVWLIPHWLFPSLGV